MEQELAFAPDRRSVQSTFYHFSERPSGFYDRKGFSQQDSLVFALDRIYQNKFEGLTLPYRKILIDILIDEVPLEHHNLTMLALANYIVYSLRSRKLELTPEYFRSYYDNFAFQILPDVTGKSAVEIQEINTRFKTTLLRYIIYVQNNTKMVF